MLSIKNLVGGGNTVKINEGYAGLLFLSEDKPPHNVISAEEHYSHDSSCSPEEVWNYRGGYQSAYCAAIDSNGYIYVGGNNSENSIVTGGALVKLSTDGTVIWKYVSDNTLYNVVVDEDGYAYFNDYSILKISPDGKKVWESTECGNGLSLDHKGYLYASNGNSIYKINCSNGKKVWETSLSNSDNDEVTVYPKSVSPDGEFIYVKLNKTDDYDNILYKLDTSDGSVIWTIDGTSYVYSTYSLYIHYIAAAKDYVYIGGYGYILKISLEGKITELSIMNDPIVYALDIDPSGCILYSYENADKIIKDSHNLGALWEFSPTSINTGVKSVIVVSPDGKYIIINDSDLSGITKIKNTITIEKIAYYE